METLTSIPDAPIADGEAASHPSLGAFCRAVGDIVATAPAAEIPSLIAEKLPRLLATADLLTPAQRSLPATGYGRHDVFICPGEAFSVLAAVWPAGIVSPIHDHLTWCALGIYEGIIRETRYAPKTADDDGTDAVPVSVTDLRPGDVVHLPVDAPDIHCMHNPTDAAASSIHVYGGDANKIGPNLKKIYSV